MKKKDERELTNKKAYQFYTDFLLKKGKTPSLRDMADAEELGFGSRERARQILARMTEDGYLIKEGSGNKITYKPNWISKN